MSNLPQVNETFNRVAIRHQIQWLLSVIMQRWTAVVTNLRNLWFFLQRILAVHEIGTQLYERDRY